jgi:hypothetical protein
VLASIKPEDDGDRYELTDQVATQREFNTEHLRGRRASNSAFWLQHDQGRGRWSNN